MTPLTWYWAQMRSVCMTEERRPQLGHVTEAPNWAYLGLPERAIGWLNAQSGNDIPTPPKAGAKEHTAEIGCEVMHPVLGT